ncbi:MAG: hypothetical protein IKA17_00450 [Clostridia bacterium]|nr:hypothetical protein [Clostridia bacterium]
MNNCFLTIITDSHSERILSACERILKELMRKFRKSVDFYQVKTYSIRPNDENAKTTVLRKMDNSDAIILIESHLSHKNLSFYENEYFCVNFHEHHIGGKCIIAPNATETFLKEDGLCIKSFISKENVRASVNSATERAKSRNSHITVCTESFEKGGALIMDELEACDNLKGIHVEYLTVQEFIWQHMSHTPFCDVIITDAFSENIIATHLSSSVMQRDGYVSLKGKYKNIYLRELLPFDEMNNSYLAGILLSYSYAIEKEMNMPNVSNWLKRAVGIALERATNSGSDNFIKEVIYAINTPIRTGRKNKNENIN